VSSFHPPVSPGFGARLCAPRLVPVLSYCVAATRTRKHPAQTPGPCPCAHLPCVSLLQAQLRLLPRSLQVPRSHQVSVCMGHPIGAPQDPTQATDQSCGGSKGHTLRMPPVPPPLALLRGNDDKKANSLSHLLPTLPLLLTGTTSTGDGRPGLGASWRQGTSTWAPSASDAILGPHPHSCSRP